MKTLVDKFTAHPHEAGESYPEHLRFTAGMAGRLIYVGLLILIHGIFPFLLTRKASSEVVKIYAIMQARIPAAAADGEIHYVI